MARGKNRGTSEETQERERERETDGQQDPHVKIWNGKITDKVCQ
jgi:hypothetical protein